jgi:AcrR family transcriptional regulator
MAATPEDTPTTAAESPSRKRDRGRRPGSSGSQDDILRAARGLFAERGYRGTTMRAIAREANVDAALIHHFFESKKGVFRAAIEESFALVQLIDEAFVDDRKLAAERLVRGFLALWHDPASRDPMLAVIRSAVADDEAAAALNDFLTQRVVGHMARSVNSADAHFRSSLAGSQLIGLAMTRYIFKIEPMASMDVESIVAFVAPTIDRYLTGDMRG